MKKNCSAETAFQKFCTVLKLRFNCILRVIGFSLIWSYIMYNKCCSTRFVLFSSSYQTILNIYNLFKINFVCCILLGFWHGQLLHFSIPLQMSWDTETDLYVRRHFSSTLDPQKWQKNKGSCQIYNIHIDMLGSVPRKTDDVSQIRRIFSG